MFNISSSIYIVLGRVYHVTHGSEIEMLALREKEKAEREAHEQRLREERKREEEERREHERLERYSISVLSLSLKLDIGIRGCGGEHAKGEHELWGEVTPA